MPHSTAPVPNGLAETGTRRTGRGYACNYKATLDVPIKARAPRRKTGDKLDGIANGQSSAGRRRFRNLSTSDYWTSEGVGI